MINWPARARCTSTSMVVLASFSSAWIKAWLNRRPSSHAYRLSIQVCMIVFVYGRNQAAEGSTCPLFRSNMWKIPFARISLQCFYLNTHCNIGNIKLRCHSHERGSNRAQTRSPLLWEQAIYHSINHSDILSAVSSYYLLASNLEHHVKKMNYAKFTRPTSEESQGLLWKS